MARTARTYYYDTVRLSNGKARNGSLVILRTLDTPGQCRRYPVYEVVLIEGTKASGPMLRLASVNARGRGSYLPDYMRLVTPSQMRLVVPEDGVELLGP